MPPHPTPGSPRTLLLTIDAFGTIFHPRDPVPQQYASAAHRFGLPRSTVTPDRLQSAFKAVFKAHSQAHPNYGRAQALRGEYGGPRQWWEEVIRGSFARVLDAPSSSSATATDSTLPDGLIQHLLDSFACRDGYALDATAEAFFTRLRHIKRTGTRLGPFDRVVVGVVSNSDDRVPAVLESLGLRVGMCRADQDVSSTQLPGFETRGPPRDEDRANGDNSDAGICDLDMVITSYEAGAEKPSPVIFEVARRQAMKLVGASEEDGRNWTCIHVGDDYDKDYRAAIEAGWKAFYIPLGEDEEQLSQGSRTGSLVDVLAELQRFE